MNATVVITTKNRKEELQKAVQSALDQTASPDVLVIDDGSTDGTSEMIRSQFPTVRLERSETSLGLVVQRNRAAAMAKGEILFSIDDDAAFSTRNTVEQTLREFDHRHVGAVAIPFIDVRKDNVVRQSAPDDQRVYVGPSFIGTAHALRRELFLTIGGYREFIFHQGEEIDFCLRMLDAGYVVRLGRADPIHHFESPRRDFRRMDLYGRKNEILFVWHNAPARYVPWRLTRAAIGGVLDGFKQHRAWRMTRGVLWGFACIIPRWRFRRPVSPEAFRLFRHIVDRRVVPLDDIENRLLANPLHSVTLSHVR
jgi:glycosyltransferase involved in cell wall biosynthesis